MKSSKFILLLVAACCIALLGSALYLQIIEAMQPCPLCIIQRYLFAIIALICIIGYFLPTNTVKLSIGLSLLTALGGIGVAGWHVWVKAHPTTSCGIDPLETTLNTVPTAKLFPLLFQADGLCAFPYPPILGLSLPQWSLIFFIIIAITLMTRLFKQH